VVSYEHIGLYEEFVTLNKFLLVERGRDLNTLVIDVGFLGRSSLDHACRHLSILLTGVWAVFNDALNEDLRYK
jgi:hypothetical protein